MTDSNYIKQSVRDENFSKRVDDAGRLYKSHAVADDIARELAEALDEMTEHVCPPHVLNTLKRYEQVMGDE